MSAASVCRVAKTPPQQVGCPFTTWSLSKLVEHLAARRRVVISTETVSTILCDAAISWRATKTRKAARILRGRVVGLDVVVCARRLDLPAQSSAIVDSRGPTRGDRGGAFATATATARATHGRRPPRPPD